METTKRIKSTAELQQEQQIAWGIEQELQAELKQAMRINKNNLLLERNYTRHIIEWFQDNDLGYQLFYNPDCNRFEISLEIDGQGIKLWFSRKNERYEGIQFCYKDYIKKFHCPNSREAIRQVLFEIQENFIIINRQNRV